MNSRIGIRRLILGILLLLLLAFTVSVPGDCQVRARNELKIPDIPGYITLKCDFHMHTVFSDGAVWPTVRVEEAWREGLDVLAITDHIEVQPYAKDIPTNYNRSYELALGTAEELGLILVRGAEITRPMPPGHLNAIFLQNIDLLDTEKWRDAVEAAYNQGAFIFWNHPGWRQPGGQAIWYQEHTELYEKGWLYGIEVVNGRSYYPDAHKICLEKNLTMLGTSDVHSPIAFDYDFDGGEHRPMTLVFAKDKTIDALKEALVAHRTAVYWEDRLIGKKEYLEPIFRGSIEVKNPEVTIKGKGKTYIQIHNGSDIEYDLFADGEVDDVSISEQVTLVPDKTVLLRLGGLSEEVTGQRTIRIPYVVRNLWIAPSEGLPVEFEIRVTFM